MAVARRINPWLFGNILAGRVLDVCPDATHTLSPDDIHVKLQQVGHTAGEAR